MDITQTFYDNMAEQYDKLYADWPAATREHAAILDAIITRQSPDICAELMRQHVEHCRTEALNYFNSDAYLSFMKNRLT